MRHSRDRASKFKIKRNQNFFIYSSRLRGSPCAGKISTLLFKDSPADLYQLLNCQRVLFHTDSSSFSVTCCMYDSHTQRFVVYAEQFWTGNMPLGYDQVMVRCCRLDISKHDKTFILKQKTSMQSWDTMASTSDITKTSVKGQRPPNAMAMVKKLASHPRILAPSKIRLVCGPLLNISALSNNWLYTIVSSRIISWVILTGNIHHYNKFSVILEVR